MEIAKLIKILQKAKKAHGNVPVTMVDSETGFLVHVQEVIKSHPFTAQYGCLNRNEPVSAIVLHMHKGNASDLILA